MGLATDIQKIEEGWSAAQYIVGRADRMRSRVKFEDCLTVFDIEPVYPTRMLAAVE